MKIPQLSKKPEKKSCHNTDWEDNYSWIHQKNILEVLKDSQKLNPEVKKYLEEEVTADLSQARTDLDSMKDLKESFFEEKLKVNEQFGYNTVIAEMLKDTGIKTKIIKPVFKDFKNGDYKIISFFAKKARGMMARFIIKNRFMNPEQLEEFNFGGYQYSHEESTDLSPVFLRDNVN